MDSWKNNFKTVTKLNEIKTRPTCMFWGSKWSPDAHRSWTQQFHIAQPGLCHTCPFCLPLNALSVPPTPSWMNFLLSQNGAPGPSALDLCLSHAGCGVVLRPYSTMAFTGAEDLWKLPRHLLLMLPPFPQVLTQEWTGSVPFWWDFSEVGFSKMLNISGNFPVQGQWAKNLLGYTFRCFCQVHPHLLC